MSLRCENCKNAKRQCLDCVKAVNKIRVRSERHKAIRREADRKYRQSEEGKEKTNARHQTGRYKQVRKEYDKRAKEKHPDRLKARAVVNARVRLGKIPHPSTLLCQDCGQSAIEYHHESYERDRWLDVVPLCGQCHTNRHPRTNDYGNIQGAR